jgi:hypothetical protein
MRPIEPVASLRATHFDRGCLAAAFGVTLVWFFVFDRWRPDYLVDEPGHIGNIYHFLEGKPGWPEQMTMLPGYHYLVAALWQLHPPLKLLTLARLVTTLASFLGLAAFAVAWTRLHRPTRGVALAGPATLLLALLPIFQPFTGLAYTDAPALAFALGAVAAHLGGHRALAALAFVPALLTRQTNLLWPTFLVVYEFLRADAPRREFLHRTRWLLLLLAFSAGAIALALATAGRLTPGTQTGNDLSFNPAILHFAGLLALVIGLPVWLAQAPAAFRDYLTALRKRRILTFVLSALALGAATALALTFRNPHQWNRDLFWDGCTFTLLRNWPLVWLDAHPWLRAASGLNLVLMAVALTLTFMRQPHRLGLWLALAFGALQPFTNSLVEPRYFIPVFAFVLLFLDLSPVTTRRLTLWWLLLCLVHAPFIARGLSLW